MYFGPHSVGIQGHLVGSGFFGHFVFTYGHFVVSGSFGHLVFLTGHLVFSGGHFVSFSGHHVLAWHFVRSKARVTARWPKHVLTFDNWLPYISRKVERRTGIKVELTSLERRLPLIFLWPKVIKVLRARPDKERPS